MSGIIWLASYPRSGNTWLRVVLSGLLAAREPDINRLQVSGIASSRWSIDTALGLPTAELAEDELEAIRADAYRQLARVGANRYLKIHDAYRRAGGSPIVPAEVSTAVVYVARNPLDVAVSLAHFGASSVERAIRKLGDEQYIQGHSPTSLLVQLPQYLRSWSTHAASWLDQEEIPVLLVRYEDMVQHPLPTFGRICEFLSIPATDLASVLERASFEKLQAQERSAGFRERPSSTPQFFRSGRTGSWRSALSAVQVARVVREHGPQMRRLGYISAAGQLMDCEPDPATPVSP